MDKEARSVIKRHAFGIRSDVRGCLCWLDDGTLMYPVGKAIALHTLSTNGQRFLEASYQSSGVTAIAVSANKKFVAVAEGGDNPQIQIIDTVTRKRRKVLSVSEPGTDRFVVVTFSADGRHLVTQGGAPSWNLYYWNWERSKPLACISLAPTPGVNMPLSVGGMGSQMPLEADGSVTSHGGKSTSRLNTRNGATGGYGTSLGTALVTEVAISPSDPLTITVSGLGMMRFYRYTDGVLQPQPSCGFQREQQEMFVTHRWIAPDRVVASMRRGGLILIINGQHVQTFGESALESTSYAGDSTPVITAIAAMRNGFVAGSDNGDVCVYELQGESSLDSGYYLTCTLKVPTHEPGEVVDAVQDGPGSTMGPAGGAASLSKETRPAGGGVTDASLTPLTSTRRRKFQVTGSKDPLSSAAAPPGSGGGGTAVCPTTSNSGRAHHASHNHTVSAAGSTAPGSAHGVGTGAEVYGRGPGAVAVEEVGYGVSCLALDQTEENLAVATRAGQVYAVDFRQNWSKVDPSSGPSFESVCQPFHTGSITGMDCSVRKPFLITASTDCSIRVWNTQTHRQEICHFYKQAAGAVAIHPNGLMAVACFPDKVRVLSVLWNSLRERCGINFRNASDVKFAKGGQFFAIMHGNLLDIFNSATCELHGQLRGHPQRIRDMQWCSTSPYPTDNRMVTCSIDGMLIDWNVTGMHKEAEHSDKRYQYRAVASDDRNVWTVAAPTSSTALEVHWRVTLREMDRHSLNVTNTASEDYEFTEAALTSLLVASHQRMLFGGADDGSIKVMTFPLQAGVQEAPISAHLGPITKMVLSFDETTLFTASADGSFFIWDIREDGARHRPRDSGGQSEEVLVTQQEMEERKVEIEGLRQHIEKLKTDIDSEEKRRNHEQGARVREKAEEFKSDAAALATEYATLWNTKAEQERAFVAIKLEKESEAAHSMEQLERTRQKEVQELEDQCSDLQHTLDRDKLKHATELQNISDTIDRERHEDAEHFNDILSQRREAFEKLTRQVERSHFTNLETLNQLELDTDAESQAIYDKNRGELQGLRERFLHMKGEGAIMRKNALRMVKEIDVRTGEVRLLDSAKAALGTQLSGLSGQIAQLHQDIDERDAVIGEKEKSIYTLKKQNQELEKHKFVLDHRIRQLKAQMEPKQREIVQHNQRIVQKNQELEGLHESNIALHSNIDELKGNLTQQQVHTKQQLNRIKDCQTYKNRVQKDIGELSTALQEPAQLRGIVSRLFDTHVVARGGARIAQANPQIKQEFTDQLQYLSTSVEALRRKVKADQERHRKEVSDMMVENLSLIREIHELRAEIHQLRTYVAADEALRRAQGTRKAKRLGSAPDISTDGGATSGGRSGSVAATGSVGAAAAASSSMAATNANPRGRPVNVGLRLTKVKPPEPPRAIEDNRAEIRMLRAYIDAMERTLGEHSRPASSSRLPPMKQP